MKLNDPQFPQFTELGNGDRVLIIRADGIVGLADKNLLSSGSSGGGGEEPPLTGVPLQFETVGDDNGVIYWYGSLEQTEAFVNPHTEGLLEFSASTVEAGPIALLADRSDSVFYTSSQVDSWVQLNLKTKKLKVTQYTLKNRASGGGYYLRNWKLQGSNNLLQPWVDLDIRLNDTTLNQDNTWGVFTCSNPSDVAFQYLRIQETGTNSSGTYHVVLGEVEFYGELTD